MKVTLQEIADQLGISRAAVSMALNDRPGISPELRERVNTEVERLGYNQKKAKPMRTEITVLYYAPNEHIIDDPIFGALMSSINNVAQRENCTVSIKHMQAGQRFPRSNFDGISGILFMGAQITDKSDLRHVQSFGLPVLLFDRFIAGESINSVTIDNRGAITSSVEWFINNGHRKIAFLSVSQVGSNSRERFVAFSECMRGNGLEAEHIIVAENNIEAFAEWMDNNRLTATAIVADTDYMAYRAISELAKRGFVVGRDVSIIGLDDLPYSSVSVPSLSSVNINNEKRGEIALKRLLEMIESPDQTVIHIEVGTRLVIRESSSPAK